MKTNYAFYRWLRASLMLAFFFAWMLAGVQESKAQPPQQFTLSISIEGIGQVAVAVPPTYTIQGPVTNSIVGLIGQNTVISVSATPQQGFEFIEWNSSNPNVVLSSTTNPNATFFLAGDVVIKAVFKKRITLTGVVANDKVYDGNTVAQISNWGSLNGVNSLLSDVTHNITAASANFDNKNIGSNKTVTVTGITLVGGDANNYILQGPIQTQASITAKPISVVMALANDKVFDNTTTATLNLSVASLSGVVSPDEVTFSVVSANFNDENVGVAKDVTVVYSLGGAGAGNYTIGTHNYLANITPKQIYLHSVAIQTKPYDGTTAATIASLGPITGVVSPGTGAAAVSVSGGTATFDTPSVGTNKVVTVDGVVVSNTNYFLAQPFTTTGTITNNKVYGLVRYYNQFESTSAFTANLKLALYQGSTLVDGPISLMTVGSINGVYEFNNIIAGQTYTLKVWEDVPTVGDSWNWKNWGGVTAADALISNYMSVTHPVTENFPWIAPITASNLTGFSVKVADVNNSNSLTAVDGLTMMYRSVGYSSYSVFPNNVPNVQLAAGVVPSFGVKLFPQAPSIVFNANGVFDPATAGDNFYYTGDFVGQNGNVVMNIYYIASGDVNASFVPVVSKKNRDLNYSGIVNAKMGDVIRIPISLGKKVELGAFNLGVNFNNQLIKVVAVEGAEVVNIDNANGTVRIAWMDRNARNTDNLVVLVAEVLSNTLAAETRYMEIDGESEIVDAAAQPIEGVSFNTVALNSAAPNSNDQTAIGLVVYPNPFNTSATLKYNMPESGLVNIVIYNKLGQVVKNLVNEVKHAGSHQIQLNSTDLDGQGAYLYKVTIEGNAKTYTTSGRLMLVK